MTSFPASPLPAQDELLINGTWTDITAYVDEDSGVVITRTPANATRPLATSRMNATLINNDGRFSNRLPTSTNYGKVGRNTRIRRRLKWFEDTFTRSQSDTWGSDWANSGGSSTDYDVNGTAATHTLTSANVFRRSTATPAVGVADHVAVVSVSATATGASMTACVGVGTPSADVVLAAQLSFTTAGNVDLNLATVFGTLLSNPVLGASVTVGTYTAGTQWYARVSLYGGLVARVKAWQAGALEPDEWAISYTLIDSALADEPFSRIYLHSRRETGNTNVNPVVSFHNSAVLDDRFTGVVPRWPQTWDLSGNDVTAPIEASGIMRQLSKGAVLESAPARWLRGLSGGSAPVASWTLEDKQLATTAAAVHGGQALRPFVGTHPSGAVITYPQWGRGYMAPWLPNTLSRSGSGGLSILWAPVSMPAFTDSWTVDIAYASGTDAAVSGIDVNPSYLGGSTGWPQMSFDPTNMQLTFSAGGLPETAATVPQLFDGLIHSVRFIFQQSGAAVNAFAYVDGQLVASGAFNPATLTAVTRIAHFAEAGSGQLSIGYPTVWTGVHVDDDHNDAVFGHRGESAMARLARLADENSVILQLIRRNEADNNGPLMGPQPLDTLLNIMSATADIAQGVLTEPRDAYALAFVDRSFLYNQLDTVALDYAAEHVFEPFAPTEDDSTVANTVTARRQYGGDATVTVTDGPLSTQDPPNGVGIYPEDRTYPAYDDTQLLHIAGWRAHLGTWDEARFPQVHANLAGRAYAGDGTLAGRALMADIGCKVTIDNPPAWLPPDLIELAILGYREEHKLYGLDLRWNCVPYGPYKVGKYDADTSRYGSDFTTTIEALDTTETGIDVITAEDKVVWITGSGGAVFTNLLAGVGGEKVSVSSIASLLSDTFTRSVSNGWGSATTGQAYTVSGTASEYSATGSVGRMTLVNTVDLHLARADIGSTDVLLVGSVTIPVLPGGGSITVRLAGRLADTSNYYEAQLLIATTGAASLQIFKRVAGVGSSVSASAPLPWTHAAGNTWKIKLSCFGSSIKARAWNSSTTSEPRRGIWFAAGTDPLLTSGTQIACLARRESGNTDASVNIDFDNVETLTPQRFTVVRSQNGVVKSHDAGAKLTVWDPAVYAY